MEPQTDLKPRISVILPALLGYQTVLAALDSWDAQTCRQQLEILVLCPTQPEPAVAQPGHRVLVTGDLLLHEALGGGGTVTLRIDAQGKTFGAALLAMEIEID